MRKAILYTLLLLLCSACGEDSARIKPSSVTLHIGESASLNAIGEHKPEWKCELPFIAEVSNKGNVTAYHAGQTVVYFWYTCAFMDCMFQATCTVTVVGEYDNAFQDPTYWIRTSPALVKEKNGEPLAFTTDGTYFYAINDKAQYTIYKFNGQSQLQTAYVVFPDASLIDMDKVRNKLHERYELLDADVWMAGYTQEDSYLTARIEELPFGTCFADVDLLRAKGVNVPNAEEKVIVIKYTFNNSFTIPI